MGSISHHITPLVIINLGGGHTHIHTYTRIHTHPHARTHALTHARKHTHTHTHTHTHIQTFVDRSNSKKPGARWPHMTGNFRVPSKSHVVWVIQNCMQQKVTVTGMPFTSALYECPLRVTLHTSINRHIMAFALG